MVKGEEMVGDRLKRIGGRKIVVAVDESEESMYALSWCLNNLVAGNNHKYFTTTLVLLYVKPPPPPYPALDVPGFLLGNDTLAAMEHHSRKLADSVMNRAEAVHRKSDAKYIKLEKRIGSGDAKEVIRETVTKLQADILVLGSHGYGFFKRALLGSVSDYCSKHVRCPVVVVKLPENK